MNLWILKLHDLRCLHQRSNGAVKSCDTVKQCHDLNDTTVNSSIGQDALFYYDPVILLILPAL